MNRGLPPVATLAALDRARQRHPNYRLTATWRTRGDLSTLTFTALAAGLAAHPYCLVSPDLGEITATLAKSGQ